jgi:hypothetical protein
MNSKDLFKQAKAKADKLPSIVKTPLLIESVMLADVARWISFQDESVNSDSIIKTANDAIELINDYMASKIL